MKFLNIILSAFRHLIISRINGDKISYEFYLLKNSNQLENSQSAMIKDVGKNFAKIESLAWRKII